MQHELAASLWTQAESANRPLGLVLAEIDVFVGYADFHGPVAADACREAVLCCLREQLRNDNDRLAGIGAGITVALLPGAGATAAGEVAERLREAVAALALPHLGRDPVGLVTLSAGVASLAPGQGRGVADLFAAAERALRAAKREGGNCIRIAFAAAGCGSLSAARLV